MTKARHKTEDPAAVLETNPFDGDPGAELAAGPRRAKPPGPTLFLGIGLVAVAGFIGGVEAHKTWGPASSASPGVTMPTGLNRQNGQLPANGSFGGLTSGTVTKVKDGVVFVKTSDGKTVQVKTSDSTKITLSESGTAGDLKAGTTVVVRGQTGSDGTVAATSVTEGGTMGGLSSGVPGMNGN